MFGRTQIVYCHQREGARGALHPLRKGPTMKHLRSKAVLGLLIAGGMVGCGHGGATLTFAGIRNPVLLGTRDRIGQKGEAPAATKVKDFDVEMGEWAIRTGNSSGGRDTNKGATDKRKALDAANEATKGDLSLNICVSDLNAGGWGLWFGLMDSSWVSVDGAVTQASPAGGK